MKMDDPEQLRIETPSKPPLVRQLWPIVAGLVVVAVVAVAVRLYLRADETATNTQRPEETTAAAVNGTVLRFAPGAVQLSYLKIQPAELFPEAVIEALSGRITYDENRTSRVSAPIAGRVESISVQLGAKVAAGQALASIDAPDYAQAIADAKRDELEVRQKRLVFDRAKLLYDGGVMPRKEYESAETDLREAEVELGRARKRLEALGQRAVSASGQFVLRSPVAGIVTERAINPGSLVGPDTAKPLFVVSDPEHLWVVVDLPEQSLSSLTVGQSATVEVDAYPGKVFNATVANVGDVLDPTTRRVQVRCAIDNAERLLKPEMYARITPLASNRVKRVRLPNAALVTLGVTSYVFVEREPGVLERRKVVPSLQGRDFTYLKEGVQPGERVVTSGTLLLNSELQGN